MFSSRTGWNLTPNALSRLLEEKRRMGEPILDLTESNPTRCGFSYNSGIFRIPFPEKLSLYEPEPHGLLSARKEIAAYYDGKGIRVDPANIFLTASTSEAYSYLFRLLCNPGESVLVPKPSYPLFDYLCGLNDVEVRHYRLRYDGEWNLDVDSILENFGPSTRALLLVHPNNPTGSFVKSGDRRWIAEFAQSHNLSLIVDEVFGEFSFGSAGGGYESFAAEGSSLTFTLNGISKFLGLPQMKLAWITISGIDAVVQLAVKRLEIITDTYLSVNTPVQLSLGVLLGAGRSITDQVRGRITANYRTLHRMTAQGPVSVLNADGGWNAIVRLPGIMQDEAWALRTLKENNVLVHPGHLFEIEQEACAVVSLLPEQTTFSNGIAGLLECVRKAVGPSS